MLVAEFAQYQEFRGFSAKTVGRRTWTLRTLAEHVAPHQLLEVTPREVIAFLSTRPSAQTRYALLSDIRQFFRWANRQQYTTNDPTALIDPPRVPSRVPTPLTGDQIHRACGAATPRVRLMIMCSAYAGLRVSEIAALHTDNLKHASRIVVRDGKGGKDRVVPLAPILDVALYIWCDGRVGQVFPRATPDNVSDQIRRTFRRVGIYNRPHDLRASFGTEAARRSNGNLVLVAALLGHASVLTIQRYVRWNPDGTDVVSDLYGDDAA